jgi:pimeloyl-ACP methyl ester carboxylesterase
MQPTIAPLAHTDLGHGEPALLFLPGWCGEREVFASLLNRTAATRRSVSVDWRGHGSTPRGPLDFGTSDLVQDAAHLIDDLRVRQVIPVALSHAGWVALELRRLLGPERVPAVVLMDWMPLGTPPGFAEALVALEDERAWEPTRAALFEMWTHEVDDPAVHEYLRSMSTYGFDMWARAGREIGQAFAACPVPLRGFGELAAGGSPCPVLHLYGQPRDDGYLAAQQAFAAEHPWFSVRRLDATSHFPCLEAPDTVAVMIDEFVRGLE